MFSLNPRTIFFVIKFFWGPQKKNIFLVCWNSFFVCKLLLFLFSDNIASLYQQQKCHKKGQMKMSLTCYKLNYISCSTQKDWKGKQNQFFCCVIKTRKLQQYFSCLFSLHVNSKIFSMQTGGEFGFVKVICENLFQPFWIDRCIGCVVRWGWPHLISTVFRNRMTESPSAHLLLLQTFF